jgi:hypothetical protein
MQGQRREYGIIFNLFRLRMGWSHAGWACDCHIGRAAKKERRQDAAATEVGYEREASGVERLRFDLLCE